MGRESRLDDEERSSGFCENHSLLFLRLKKEKNKKFVSTKLFSPNLTNKKGKKAKNSLSRSINIFFSFFVQTLTNTTQTKYLDKTIFAQTHRTHTQIRLCCASFTCANILYNSDPFFFARVFLFGQ